MIVYKEDAQAIVDRLISILGKNINIIDKNGNIIASGDKCRIGQIHEAGRIAAQQRQEVIVNKTNIGQYPGSKPGVNLPVYYKNEVICVVGITGSQGEVQPYGLIVRELVELMFQKLENNRFEYLKGRALRSFARELLKEHDAEGANSIISRANLMEFTFSMERTVIEIDVDKFSPQTNSQNDINEVMLQNIKQQIDDNLNPMLKSDEIAFNLYGCRFIVLRCSNSNMIEFSRSIMDMLKRKFDIQCHIGIGCSCKELNDYSRSYNLADKALEAGKKIDYMKRVYTYDDYKFHVLIKSSDKRYKESYLNGYKRIFECAENNENMLKTIKVYFENNMNLNDTAKVMYIHKNTVLYRLNRFKDIYGIDVFNVGECCKLYTAILLHYL